MPDIRMPDGQVVRFPDTMSETNIRGLIAQRYPKEIGEAGAAKPMAERETAGHYAFDGSNVPGFDQSTGMVPDQYDASKSYGAGLRRGAEGLVGAAGDVGGLQGNLVSWLAGKMGVSPETADTVGNVASKLTPFVAMPKTEDIQKITNPIIGEGYQPESTLGKYASTMGEFGAGALAPGGVVRKTAMMAVPAVASEFAGQQTEGTAYEPYARLGAGLLAGGLVSPGSASKTLKSAASDMGTKTKDMTRILKQMQRDGMTPTQINARLAELGPDATLMDVGPNLRQEGQRIFAKGGRGRGVIDEVLSPRDQGANSRIRGEIDANLGTAPVPSKIDAGLRTAQKSLSPEYEAALGGAKAVNTQTIANDLQSAIANERGAARTALESVLDDLRVKGTDVLDPHPRAALATRQAIDGMIRNTQDTNVQRVLGGFRKKLDAELTRVVPGIKDVDAKFANLAKQREAVERGQTVLDSGRTSLRPIELADEVSKGGPVIRGRLAQGARAEIDRIVGTNANDRVALQRIIKGEGDWNRQKLATLFGQDRAGRIIGVLDREGTFAETSNRTLRNSATAERLQEGSGPVFGVREGLMAGGVKGAAYSAAVRGVEKAIEKIGLRNTEASDANVAGLLTTQDRNRIVTALIKANDGRPVSQAQIEGAVRAALIGIESSEQSSKQPGQ